MKNVTPHIIEVKANNGWRGYAHYDKTTEAYEGAMEWEAGKGGSFNENKVYVLDLVHEKETLTIYFDASHYDFSATFRKK